MGRNGFAAVSAIENIAGLGRIGGNSGKIQLLPPTKAGALMADLNGKYLLRQNYCPSCAVLLDTDFVEEDFGDARRA